MDGHAKTRGYFLYATSRFLYHFVAICKYNLETLNRVKLAIFCCVVLNFDGWSSKTVGHLFYATSISVRGFVTIGEFELGITI